MGVVNRLIRHVFGTLAAPATIQNLMAKTDIGISGSSDRSRFIVKDNFGVEHRFITQDEVQSLIDSGVASATGVYLIISDVASLIIALEEPQVLNIWWNGEDITSTPIVATLLSDKNIYCNSPDSLSFATIGFQFTFPTSLGSGETAFLSFYNGLTSVGAIVDTVGGVDSSKTGIRITTQRGGNNLGATVSASAPIIVENFDMPSVSTIANVVSGLWSGLNTELKLDSKTWAKDSSTVGLLTVSREKITLEDNVTSGVEFYQRVLSSINSLGIETERLKESLTAESNYLVSLKTSPALNLTPKVLGISTLVYPWSINAIDLHDNSASYDNGTDSGIAHNAYYNGSWRAKSTGTCQRIEFESNGDKVEYTSASTTVDLAITWIETKRTTKEGNIAYNGATIPTNLLSTLSYEFREQYVIMVDKTTGTNWRAIGCYRNDSGDYLCTTTGAMSFLVMGSGGSFTHYKKTTGNTIGVEYAIGDFTATVIA